MCLVLSSFLDRIFTLIYAANVTSSTFLTTLYVIISKAEPPDLLTCSDLVDLVVFVFVLQRPHSQMLFNVFPPACGYDRESALSVFSLTSTGFFLPSRDQLRARWNQTVTRVHNLHFECNFSSYKYKSH